VHHLIQTSWTIPLVTIIIVWAWPAYIRKGSLGKTRYSPIIAAGFLQQSHLLTEIIVSSVVDRAQPSYAFNDIHCHG